MGVGKQVGRHVRWDGSSSCGWRDRGAFKGAGADPCSRTQPWILNPVWEVQAEALNCILPRAWESSGGYCYLPTPCLCSALAPALGHAWRQDRWEDILAQKDFLMFVCRLLFSSMHVPQALQNVSNLARGNRIGSSLPLFITVNREKVFNVEKTFSLSP